MAKKKDWIGMILAGGQGSRLFALTQKVAKPAVPYGGKYRIIDFPLSNCVNSGIDTVGVLTQYQPLVLNEYLGNGQPWDLNRNDGGVFALPPYQTSKGSDWYSGTANAIYQNISFIERYDPEDVLILSGDHIYKMDYTKMLEEHHKNDAACTIAVLNVSLEEASRFGIMNCNPDGSVYEFEEKPKQPKSTLASMGIYIFNWKKLRKYLEEDEANPESDNDFGKNIIPNMLNNQERLYTYRFDGYWKDVGTIYSLWEANMDVLDPSVPLDLSDPSWKIYSRNPSMPPHFASDTAEISNSMVTEGCCVEGKVVQSILFSGVTVEEGAVIDHSIIMPGSVIRKGAKVEYSIIAENVVVEEGAHIGAPGTEIAHVASGVCVPADSVIAAGAKIYTEKDIPAVEKEAE